MKRPHYLFAWTFVFSCVWMALRVMHHRPAVVHLGQQSGYSAPSAAPTESV